MKGQILDYSVQENKGVISGSDGKRYAFLGTEWKGDVHPSRGKSVDFDIEGGEAVAVYLELSHVESQKKSGQKSKVVAGLLAFFLGALGIHRFYLGQWWGLFYLLLFWTGIPSIISLFETFVFLFSNQKNWNNKYGDGGSSEGSSAISIVIALCIVILGTISWFGMLAAIALPAYQDYIVRSKMSEPLAAMAAAKTAISEYAVVNRQYPKNTRELGIDTNSRSAVSEVLEQIVVVAAWDKVYVTALIDACTWDGTSCSTSEADDVGAFSLLGHLNADGSMSWECVPGDAQGQRAVERKYLPSNCRDL